MNTKRVVLSAHYQVQVRKRRGISTGWFISKLKNLEAIEFVEEEEPSSEDGDIARFQGLLYDS
ncbi:hypothetical protein COT72_03145 [archaeon CG10_big_fil_rev_8_21_14_0_10_43_11]|nr:MAG: hypothetical protein COT72_03145 [archaeon CG10_big_fil_rev_8_21_14_0_10_43_11]